MSSSYQVGDLARLTATFRDVDEALVDPTTVTFTWRTPAGVEASYVYETDDDLVSDSTGVYYVDLALDEAGPWVYRWDTTGIAQGSELGALTVTTNDLDDAPARSFATADELAARLGRSSLSTAEEAQAELLLQLATGLVAEAAGEDDDWARDLFPVPTLVKTITIEVARRGFLNPDGATSSSHRLGQYEVSQGHRRDSGTMELSKTERLQIRRVVHGAITASARAESLADMVAEDVYDLADEAS